MVVSAILTTALAPITGALFGASYGTSIRIGYEIIFPALFGDVINEQKNNPTKLQEQGTKRTIESMHKMFTGVGGAAAMEFGIEQGIEMAKKKTESPDVQDMIDLSLGITPRQLNKRGKAQQFQDPVKDKLDTGRVESFKKTGDFEGMGHSKILDLFKNAPLNELKTLRSLLKKWFRGRTNITTDAVDKIIKTRNAKRDTPKQAIESAGSTGVLKQIALNFNQITSMLKSKTLIIPKTGKVHHQRPALVKFIINAIKKYNQLVQQNRKSGLALDALKSIKAGKAIKK